MPAHPSLARFLPWAVLAASAALLAVLAQRHRDLTQAFTALRERTLTLRPGDVVPTFRTTTLDGAPVTVGAAAPPDARQVLFILRTSCPYCRATLPIWQSIADSLRRVAAPPIQVLAISLDSAAPSRGFARANGLPYPVLLLPERKLTRLYRIVATPQTLVLNAEGRVLYTHTGLLASAAVRDSVFRAATAPRPGDSLPLTTRRTAGKGGG